MTRTDLLKRLIARADRDARSFRLSGDSASAGDCERRWRDLRQELVMEVTRDPIKAFLARRRCPGTGRQVVHVPNSLGVTRCEHCSARVKPFRDGTARPHNDI